MEMQAQLRQPHQLRYVIFGGEALNPSILKGWYRHPGDREPVLANMYGITETTVHTTFRALHRKDSEGGGSPIGRRLGDVRIYLLDRHGRPVPLGAVGEIHIGGAGVARGYLRQPQLTAERFLADPFDAEQPARMYRTGDLGRYCEDGNIEFLGRNDEQLKIRGYRIEPGEIEARLREHPWVKEAVVLACADESGQQSLVAYVVTAQEAAGEKVEILVGASGGKETSDAEANGKEAGKKVWSPAVDLIAELRGYLKGCLPQYMVPAAFVRLERLPLTPNGKLDRRSLPAPQGDAYVRGEYEAPQGEVEELLAGVWQELLGVERVGRNDNFFELGGHSLLAVRLITRVEVELDCHIELSTIFKSATLAAFSKSVLIASIEQEFDSREIQDLIHGARKP
jgi:acyl-coenzyme A synthetase/AMP-(fatty) acid ligase/acyl carrier protein